MPLTLGQLSKNEFDDEGFERRERVGALADCPQCGAEIGLMQQTEEWSETPDGRWQHSGWGPAMGVCEKCGLLIVDSWDGCEVYDLNQKGETAMDPDDDDFEQSERDDMDPDYDDEEDWEDPDDDSDPGDDDDDDF
jgi:hypothetical protein